MAKSVQQQKAKGNASKTPRTIKLGNIVRDPITGFQGIATQAIQLLNGNIQFAVQAKCKNNDTGTLPEAYNFDYHLLEFVGEGLEKKVTPEAATNVKLGDEVEDSITGIKGITTLRSTFINGCVYFSVQPRIGPKAINEDQHPKTIFMSHDRLKVIKSGAFKPIIPQSQPETDKAEKPISASPSPGGPTTRAMRMT